MMHPARIVICNQPYIEMFGLSPDVAKPGCTMHRLIEHRKETGSFDGDVEAFCNAIIRTVSLGKATRQLTEAPGGRAIEIVNRPLKVGRLGRHHRGHHRAHARRARKSPIWRITTR